MTNKSPRSLLPLEVSSQHLGRPSDSLVRTITYPGLAKDGPESWKDATNGEEIVNPNSKHATPGSATPGKSRPHTEKSTIASRHQDPQYITPVNTEESWGENHPQL